jgi:hypothetical protein
VGKIGASAIPAYRGLDSRVSWRFTPNIELSVAGHDLLSPAHLEYEPLKSFDGSVSTVVVKRGGQINLMWKF